MNRPVSHRNFYGEYGRPVAKAVCGAVSHRAQFFAENYRRCVASGPYGRERVYFQAPAADRLATDMEALDLPQQGGEPST